MDNDVRTKAVSVPMNTIPLTGNDAVWSLPFTMSFLTFSSNFVKLRKLKMFKGSNTARQESWCVVSPLSDLEWTELF